jgi:hypothetical protein
MSEPLDYRAFVLGPDGHVRDRYDLLCATEDEAKERARHLVDGHDVELWHRDRKIAVFRHNE